VKTLTIGIVENDLLIAESIIITLQQIGYQTTQAARTYDEAIHMIESEQPDLLLIDIKLEGDRDGIDLAATINKDYAIPFLFLTANSDSATVNRAKEVKPYAYLIKPFNGKDLFSSIEIAFSNFNRQNNAAEEPTHSHEALKDFVFIKEGDLYHKVEVCDIIYIESDNVYLNIYTEKRRFVIRAKLDEFVTDFAKACFLRVHRSFAINLKHLETINNLSVKVAGKEIPLHKGYRQELLSMINTLK
jgi:DNA-binding LytR/AlgR family response regulator